MIFVSKAASVLTTRAIPALTSLAVSNPIATSVVAAGSLGLAAWKGSELAVQAAPMVRSIKAKVHTMTAPQPVKQAAESIHEVATVTEMRALAQAAMEAADKAARAAEEANRRVQQAETQEVRFADAAFAASASRSTVNGHGA